VKKAERALADFAINLYKNASTDQEHEDKNQAISPISIALALAMLENGANGQTRDRLRRQLVEHNNEGSDEVLEIYSSLEKQLEHQQKSRIQLANAIFHDKDIRLKPEYEQSTRQCLEAQVQDADFHNQLEQSRQKINEYISQKTNHKITELIKRDQLKAATKVVLVNALHFKASWERAFKKEQTKKVPFYRRGKEQERQDVNMMKADGQYRHSSDEKLQVIELPYEQNELAMYVLLPKQRDGLKELERSLTGDQLRQHLSRLQRKQVRVQLPKFGVRSNVDLKSVLSRMGLETVFSDQADLSRISEEKLKVTHAAHEAYIQVEENGTEGSAATEVVADKKSAITTTEESTEFNADHPFLYTIVHPRTGAVLFIGKVNEVHENADE
jgi:serine protease inhibitor